MEIIDSLISLLMLSKIIKIKAFRLDWREIICFEYACIIKRVDNRNFPFTFVAFVVV